MSTMSMGQTQSQWEGDHSSELRRWKIIEHFPDQAIFQDFKHALRVWTNPWGPLPFPPQSEGVVPKLGQYSGE